jgi:hypothetical protein
MSFSFESTFGLITRGRLGKSLWHLEISNKGLKKQEMFLPLLDPTDVSNIILLRKLVIYQLKQCHIPKSLNQELQNWSFASSSPLTTKHSDR